MNDAVERLVNLAFFLADAAEPVSRERIRTEVAGYPADQDPDAFLRMFERDKDQLRAAGFTIITDEDSRYSVDRSATFASTVELTAEEIAALRAAGGALLADPSFPFNADLRLALTKIAAGADTETRGVAAASRLADENPARQGADVTKLSSAASSCKLVSFGYTNSYGAFAPHEVEPYGLFLHDGRWYLVGRDATKDEIRTYTVARMASLAVNRVKPATPDFIRPDGFDVSAFVRLPFQYGTPADEFEATATLDGSMASRVRSLTAGQGMLSPSGDSLVWRVSASCVPRLLRFILESGPGIRLTGPAQACAHLRAGLESVVRAHV